MKAISKTPLIIVSITAIILLIPLISMQFSSNVNWNIVDFTVAGALLLGAGFSINFLYKRLKNKKYAPLVIAAIIILLLLIWAEMAVGLFGSPFAGN